MNKFLILKALNVAIQTSNNSTSPDLSINWWMWVALIESVLIIILILRINCQNFGTPKQKYKEGSLNQDIDFKNIINSSFHSISLYDELKVKCHPDKFIADNEKNAIADKLFQEITKNKTNVKKLLELKEEAKSKLNINF